MRRRVTRRDFMRTLVGSGVGMYGLALSPRTSLADPGIGSPYDFRVLVRLELRGGCDSHALWLPLDGDRFNALASRRPQGMFAANPGGTLDIGFGQGIGLHPNLAPLLPHIPELRFFMNTSNDMANGQSGSHENAQNLMAVGSKNTSGGLRGWTAAVFDNEPTCQLVTFFGAHGADGQCNSTLPRCSTTPPPSVNTFETFTFDGNSFDSRFGGANNSAYIADVIKRLAEARAPTEQPSIVEEKFDAAMRGTFPAIEQVQETLTYQSPLYGSYGSSVFATQLRNVAMKVKQMVEQNSTERIIFTLGLGGFDLHDDWNARALNLTAELGAGLGTFMSDLKAMNAHRNVVLISGTEFGRTHATNGSGTDHGRGSTTLVLGGTVKGGSSAVYGDILTPTEFSSLTLAPARMDNRGVIATILDEFMGIAHTSAFPGPISSEFTIEDYDLFV